VKIYCIFIVTWCPNQSPTLATNVTHLDRALGRDTKDDYIFVFFKSEKIIAEARLLPRRHLLVTSHEANEAHEGKMIVGYKEVKRTQLIIIIIIFPKSTS